MSGLLNYCKFNIIMIYVQKTSFIWITEENRASAKENLVVMANFIGGLYLSIPKLHADTKLGYVHQTISDMQRSIDF